MFVREGTRTKKKGCNEISAGRQKEEKEKTSDAEPSM
jgi:hypothetical protein